MWTLIDFHINRVLDAALMNHAGEHGRGNRTATETRGDNADLGLRVLFLPLFCLVDKLPVHLLHPWPVAITQRTVEIAR
ncbi:hypothetical protein WCN79_16045 [Xanthomonas axonopodis pv. vasculorum]|uniref:hypothetical protein n=1 Tax=Xanthomonas axonopodis TaxID=53413 RepID=UPI003D782092